MTDDQRAIELEVEVPGTPEEVWQAIATGPGISSWYVPHTVEERAGGAATASFGDGPEMQVAGRVAAWEPPHRIVFDGGEGVPGLAFEWLVEARDGGSCLVRLVNTGFGTGAEWDGQYDAMTDGWRIFLRNLALHMERFRGRAGVAVQPMAVWQRPKAAAFADLLAALRVDPEVSAGDAVRTGADDAPVLAGTVVERMPTVLVLVIDEPAPGTAFIAAEGMGGGAGVSVWSYLYGSEAAVLADRDRPRWQAWLDARAAG